MASMNSWNFTGRLGRDPELRSTSGGREVCSLAVAVDRFGDKGALWVDVSVWGKQAESCARFLAKGREVAISGRVDEVHLFDKRDGSTGFSLRVSANDVSFIGGRSDGGGSGSGGGSDVAWDAGDFQPATTSSPAAGDDDIPF